LVQAGELTVYETSLDGESTSREAFLGANEGSAFVPRLGEVVLIRCSGGGLPALQAKAEQLVDKGLHAIVVSLAGVDGADAAPLLDTHDHVDRFVGWVCFCDLSDDLRAKAQALAAERGVELVLAASTDQAFELLKARGEPPPSEEGVVEQAGDASWGWSSDDAVEEDASAEGLPKVEVSELFVEATELPGLREQVSAVLGRGRHYVTLRLHVARDHRMESSDVTALSEARDLLDGAGGQLVMVALQQEFLKWLRLLDEEKNFQIVETAEDAERLHREHASRGVAVLGPALQVVSHEGDRYVVRPPEGETAEGETILTGRLLQLAPAGLPGLGPRIHALAEAGVQAVVVAMGQLEAVEGLRFEPVVGAIAAARARGVRLEFARVSHEVRAMLKLLHVDEGLLHAGIDDAVLALASEVYLRAPFAEATLALAPEALSEPPPQQDPVSEIQFESELGELERPSETSQADALRAELAQAQGELARLREQLEQRAAETAEAQQQAQDGAAAERQFLEAEQARRRAEARVEELEQELAGAREQAAQAEGSQALEQELSSLREQAAQSQEALAEREGRIGELEGRVGELEQAGAQAVEDLAEAKAELVKARQATAEAQANAEAARSEAQAASRGAAQPGGGGSGDADGDLQARVEQLEVEKARILTEAETEIQRLLRNQEQLREELESAGDMIERLGKELELS
jgi:anti-anti-sigma regulatory factor